MYSKDHKADIIDNYAFHFLEDVKAPLIRLSAIGREARYSSQYHWENRKRGPAYLFQYTLKGSGTVKIGGQEHILDEGKAFFLKMPGEESYYFDEKHNRAPWELVFIMLECHGAERYCQYIEEHLGKIISLPISHEAIQLLLKLHADAKGQRIQSPFLLSSRAFEFLCLLCCASQQNADSGSGLIERARDYIRRSSGRPIGISDVAAFLKVSPSHLSREFYKSTGMKPIDYLTRVRLEKAVDLLASSDIKIEGIGNRCGFSSANYFGKVFKRHMAMTPAQFRSYIQREGYSKIQI